MQALQDRFAAKSICFGCGPANDQGLQLKSYVKENLLIAHWKPNSHHHAFPGVLNGGIIGAILDCHSNWAAAWALCDGENPDCLPCTVTADFHIQLRKPTPMNETLTLIAHCVKVETNRATVHATLTINSILYDSCDATFVAVGADHPAHHRW